MSLYTPVPSDSRPVRAGFMSSITNPCSKFWSHMRKSFRSLEGSPRELYINFALHFCDTYSYFALSQVLVVYLHYNFGVSDLEAGAAYGFWGAAITFWGFVMGCFNDRLGIRRSLLLGFTICLLSNTIIALTASRDVILAVLFLFLPIGNCLGVPMLTIAVKRTTTKRNRGFAFGVYYSVMNVAALLSGPVVDVCNLLSPDQRIYLSGSRLVVFSVVVANLVSLLITFFLVRDMPQLSDNSDSDDDETAALEDQISVGKKETEVETQQIVSRRSPSQTTSHAVSPLWHETSTEETHSSSRTTTTTPGAEDADDQPHTSSAGIVVYNVLRTEPDDASAEQSKGNNPDPAAPTVKTMLWELLSSLTFWRFVIFTLFLVNLKSVFRHLDATLPSYLLRCFGPTYPRGLIYAINPLLIVFLTPVIAAVTSHLPHYDLIKYGGYITAAAPFSLALSSSTPAVVFFMVALSLGEALWSPRVYDYTMSIAPQGREATFSALAALPLFAAKIPVGLLSGYLLSTYLPEGRGEQETRRSARNLWLIVGLLTLSSPLLITACESCIREPETPKDKGQQQSKQRQPNRVHASEEEDEDEEGKGLELSDLREDREEDVRLEEKDLEYASN